MPAIGCFRYKGSGLDGFEPVGAKVLADLIGAYQHILMAKLGHDPSEAITAFMFPENSNHLLFHHGVFSFLLVSSFIVPFIKTAPINLQYLTDLTKRMIIADCIGKGIHYCQVPRLKIPKAFLKYHAPVRYA